MPQSPPLGPSASSHRRPAALAALVFFSLLLLALVLAAARSERTGTLADALQRRAVDAGALGAGATRQILRRLDLIHQLPASADREQPWGGREIESLDPLPAEEVPEVLGVDPAGLASGLPVVALRLPDAELAAMLRDVETRGRESEHRAYVAYLDDGRLLFTSGVGLRIHGGASRPVNTLRHYRLHFRDVYGADHFEPPVFDRPARQVVLANNNDGRDAQGWRWHFINALSLDVARLVGMPAPQTRPVLLYLNGRRLGVYLLSEYLGRDYLESRHGHDRFVLVRSKRNRGERGSPVKTGDPARYDELLTWLHDPAPLTWAEAARRVDLDNLSRWFLTVLFCATGDVFNGPLILDETRPDARWYWIAWDLEIGFGQPYFPRHQAGWQRETIPFMFHVRHRRNPRSVLLRRLFAESPEFRREFARLFSEVMNHRLRENLLVERLAHYRDLADRAEVYYTGFFDEIEEFLAHRKGALRDQARRHLGAGESYPVRVEAPPGYGLEVDGYREGSPYEGWYFAGQEMTVRLGGHDGALSARGGGGESYTSPGRTLTVPVTGELRLQIAPERPS